MGGEALLLVLILIGSAVGVWRRDSAREKESQRTRYELDREQKREAEWQKKLEQVQQQAFEDGLRRGRKQREHEPLPADTSPPTPPASTPMRVDDSENYFYIQGYEAGKEVASQSAEWNGMTKLVDAIGIYVEKGRKGTALDIGNPWHADTWDVRRALTQHLGRIWGQGIDEGRKLEKRLARERRRKQRAKEQTKEKKQSSKSKSAPQDKKV